MHKAISFWYRSFFLIALVAQQLPGWAQGEATAVVGCGQELFLYIVREHYPQLYEDFEATFKQCRQSAVRSAAAAAERSEWVIPVVLHVVWKQPEENLPDSVLLDQMAVLNEDFNRLNADTANLRAIFQPVAGNARIRFQLDEIRRVKTNANFQLNIFDGNLMANLKSSAQGGSDAKDPSRYLNIWICRIQPISIAGIPLGQILGFAFPPNNLPNWPANSGAPEIGQDGVVIDFRTVGRNNPNPLPHPTEPNANLVIRGRTATHEVGHYLGLRHIWGDGGLLGLPNNCNQSDGIDDTPFANAQSDFDCNKSRNTCVKIEPYYGTDMPDLVENYMDYAREDCMNMFTRGQVDHMRAVLAGPRKNIVVSTAQLASQQELPAIYPNPARTADFWISLPPAWQPAHLSLWSTEGRLLWETHVEFALFQRQMRVALQPLAAGWYVVRLQQEQRHWIGKVFVQP